MVNPPIAVIAAMSGPIAAKSVLSMAATCTDARAPTCTDVNASNWADPRALMSVVESDAIVSDPIPATVMLPRAAIAFACGRLRAAY